MREDCGASMWQLQRCFHLLPNSLKHLPICYMYLTLQSSPLLCYSVFDTVCVQGRPHTHKRVSENDDICLTHTQESQWKWRHLPFRLSSHLLYSLICVEDRCCHNIIDGLCTFKTREYRLPRYFMIINCQDNGWEDLRYFILKFAATSFILTHLMLFNARSYATSSLLPGQLLPGHLLTGHLLTGHLLPLHLSPGHLLSEDLLPTPYLQLH